MKCPLCHSGMVLLGKFQRASLTEQTVEFFCEGCERIIVYVVKDADIVLVRDGIIKSKK